MKLSLKHISAPTSAPAAAYLPGSEPALWLREMARWKLPWKELQCYPVPQSLEDNRLAGLLVIFPANMPPQVAGFPNPYVRAGARLFIPQDSALSPPLLPAELDKLSSWEVQFLHPVIGLVGFEHADAIALTDLFQLQPASKKDWGSARKASPQAPRLQSISIEAVSVEDVFTDIQKDIKPKSLKDIPGLDDDSEGENLFDKIGYNLLKGSSSLLESFMDNFATEMTPEEVEREGLPPLSKLQNWLSGKMNEIQKRRDKELNRLEKLFDEDPDEALRYAIPLNSPYAGRGTSQPGSQLGRRNTDFSLGGLGGGMATDNWNVDDARYYTLRRKYTEAANRAIAECDFRKAAYIHAQLLGSFHEAANVLEQGGHFREAAVLFKDHLHDKRSAAHCYAEGGMLNEAAVLYEEVKEFEKAGDLFEEIGNKTKSQALFQKASQQALSNKDPLKAGQLLADKLGEVKEAEDCWFEEGWKKGVKAEDCLNAWLGSVAQDDEAALIKKLDQVYKKDTSTQMEDMLGKVLLTQKQQQNSEVFDAFAERVSYEVIAQNLQKDKKGKSLNAWKRMLPEDPLLRQDFGRFFLKKEKPLPPLQDVEEYAMVQIPGTYWSTSFVCLGQLFLVGVNPEERKLVMAIVKENGMHELLLQALPDGIDDVSVSAFPDLDETGDVMIVVPGVIMGEPKWEYKVNGAKLRFFFASNMSTWTIGMLQQGGISHYLDLEHTGARLSMYQHAGKELIIQSTFKDIKLRTPKYPELYPFLKRKGINYLFTNISFQVFDESVGEFSHLASLNEKSAGLHWCLNPYNRTSDWIIWAKKGLKVARMLEEDAIEFSEPFLIPLNDEFEPKLMAIIPVEKCVLASHNEIRIYDLSEDVPSLNCIYPVEENILDLQMCAERNYVFAILANGKVMRYACE